MVFSMEGNAWGQWADHWAQEQSSGESSHVGGSGLDYATFYKGENCEGEKFDLPINADGSPAEFDFPTIRSWGWNDKAVSV